MILSIDVSHRLGLICLELEDGSRLVRHSDKPREHLEFIQGTLRDLAAVDGRSWTELSRVAVTLGPGSFTGLRVGLAAAKGLIFGTDIPLLPLSSLAVPARAADPATPRVIIRPARSMEIWTAFFAPGESLARDEGLRTRSEARLWVENLSRAWPRLQVIGEVAEGGDEFGLIPEAGPDEQLIALAELARQDAEGVRGDAIDRLLPNYMAEPSVTFQPGKKS